MFVLDTSAVLNLLGSEAAPRLLRGLAESCLVEERVITELKYHPIPGRDIATELERLISERLLTKTRMSETAYEVFIGLAAIAGIGGLGIGESAAIAVAQEIGGAAVLDDRKARKRAEGGFPTLPLSSSTRLFLRAAESSDMTAAELRSIFLSAQANSCMGILRDERSLVAHLGLFEQPASTKMSPPVGA